MLHPFSFDIFGVLVGFCCILIRRFGRMSLFKFATGDFKQNAQIQANLSKIWFCSVILQS